jgi:serine/threonine protein kinase
VLGKTLDGKYRIQRLLGSGGMGSVYAAEDLSNGRMVAVKVIHKNLADGQAVLARFEREARAAGSIDTEHIARCFGSGIDPETESPYMVLEYLVGEDLQHALRRLGPIGVDVALRITAQACIGVAKAHEASVFHRDIKPANIFLAQNGEGTRIVKVLDFGVAKIRRDPSDMSGEDTAGGLTRTGSILGSPLYMSPEQARSVKNVDHRSDIWSLGVVLYQAVAGRTPYEHISGLGDLILALCSDLPPPVQQFAPWVPPEVAALIDRALRIEPGERFKTAGAMVDALRDLCPDGIGIRDEMLVSLDDATHDSIAPTYFRTPGRTLSTAAARAFAAESLAGTEASLPPPPPLGSIEHALARASNASNATSAPGNGGLTQSAVSTTGSGLPDTGDRRLSQAAPRSQVSVIAFAVACIGLGGAGVYGFVKATTGPGGAPPVSTVGAALPTAAPVVTGVPTVTAGSAATTGDSASPPGSAAADPLAGRHPGPMPSSSATALHGRLPAPTATAMATTTATAAPSVTASAKVAPPDYSSFGGRK